MEKLFRWYGSAPDAEGREKIIRPGRGSRISLGGVMAKNKQRVLIITSAHTHPVPSRVTMPLHEATALLGENATVTVIPDGVGVIVQIEQDTGNSDDRHGNG